MLHINRGNLFKLATLLTGIVILALFVILIFSSGWVNGSAAGKQTAHSNANYDYSQDKIEACLNIVSDSAKADCFIKLVSTHNDQKRSEAELIVQTEIATWTFGMLIVAMLTVVITSIGIWYVRATLIQANSTNSAAVSAAYAANEANRIMRQEARPWVTIKREVSCEITDNGFSFGISWNYDLINKGKSPAYDVKINWKAVKRSHLQGMYVEAEEYAQKIISNPRLKGTPIIFPGEKTDLIKHTLNGWARYDYDHSDIDKSQEIYIVMFICLSYRLALQSDEFGAEVIVVGFDEETRWLGPYGSKMLEYSTARFIQ